MPSADRAFRALARDEPETLIALLAALRAETGVPLRETPSTEDSHLDAPPPPMDADWVARLSDGSVLHVECQGYRDTTFPERLFWYHLMLVVRYRPAPVRTMALWLIAPPEPQRRSRVTIGAVTVKLEHHVLTRVPAAELLQDPRTACFAMGADAQRWDTRELAERVVAALAANGAPYYQRHMAACLAAARSDTRYKELIQAMHRAGMQPVIIEDLVKYGEDLGLERGRVEGRVESTRERLLEVCDARALALSPEQRAHVAAESSEAALLSWFRRALTAPSADHVFAADLPTAGARRR